MSRKKEASRLQEHACMAKVERGGGRHTDYKMFRKEEDKGQPYREAASIENANVSSTHGAKVMEKNKLGTKVEGLSMQEIRK